MSNRFLSRVAGCGLLIVLVSSPLAAGPTTDDLEAPLALWNTAHNETLHSEAEALCRSASKAVANMKARREAKLLKSLKLLEIGKTHVALNQISRRAERLSYWGEPSGRDFFLRVERLRTTVSAVLDEGQVVFDDQLKKNNTAFNNRVRQKVKSLEVVRKLIDKEKLEEAETRFLPIYDELEAIAVWYSPGGKRAVSMVPFDNVYIELAEKLNKQRRAEALEAMAAMAKEQAPDTTAILKQLAEATAAVKLSGKSKIDGEELTGPELLARFGEKWRAAQLAALRCVALAWADPDSTSAAALQSLSANYATFNQAMPAAIVGLIKADADRATGATAVELSGQYALALAPLLAVGDAKAISAAAAPAFEALAAKNMAIHAYQAATSDLLRWRARAADARTRAARKEYSQMPAAQVFDGLLNGPAPQICEKASALLVDKKVTAVDLIGGKGNATGGAAQNIFPHAKTPAFEDIAAELATELFVAPNVPPLSLEAAAALDATRRGDLAEVGGAISGVELEALIPLYGAANAESWGLTRLAPLPATPFGLRPIDHLLLRYEIQPKWLRGKYFFQQLP